jgi:hypothetical protein
MSPTRGGGRPGRREPRKFLEGRLFTVARDQQQVGDHPVEHRLQGVFHILRRPQDPDQENQGSELSDGWLHHPWSRPCGPLLGLFSWGVALFGPQALALL